MKGFIKIAVLIAAIYLAIEYYKKNYTVDGRTKAAAEDVKEAASNYEQQKAERAALRQQEYSKCNAQTYGNPNLDEGAAWNAYQICTMNVDAVFPAL